MRTVILLSAIIIAYAILGNDEFLKDGVKVLDLGLRFFLSVFFLMDFIEYFCKIDKPNKLWK